VKDDYIRHVVLLYLLDGNFDVQFEGWIDSDEFEDLRTRTAFEAFAVFGLRAGKQYEKIVDDLFGILIDGKGFSRRGDDYTGYWYKLNVAKKNEVVNSIIANNSASKALAGLPDAALSNALDRIAEEDGLSDLYIADTNEAVEITDLVEADIVPASDRMVTLSHNQIAELDEGASKIISEIEALNSIDGDHGLRSHILGGLMAGRELIRAGAFKIYAIEFTLIESLKFIAKRYERETIGALAAVLLSALASHLGIPS
jgi:hypothetical protein